ncbi:substrate-binding periplasmic protein [Thalassotalea fusca]
MPRLFTLILILVLVNANANSTDIIIAGDNWCPINCQQDSNEQGFMIDVAIAALQQSGYKVKYVEMPWLRAIQLAREGKIHAIVGAFQDDAPDFHYPNISFLKMSPSSLFTKKESSWQYANLRSFNEVRLGVVKGYDYGHLLNTYIRSINEDESQSLVQLSGNDAVARNIEFLMRNRIDVFVDADPVFWYQAKKMNIADKVKYVGSVSPLEPCYIAFSPVHPMSESLVLALDKGVISLKQSKAIAKIADKYGIPQDNYQ